MTGAGDLRTIAVFERLVETPDGYGGHERSWVPHITTHVQYRAESGREAVETGRIEATARATLRCRASAVSAVDESWRVLISGTLWNIRSVIPFGQRRQWTDMVIERGGKGVAA